jgi:hypothetical protein
MAIVTDLMERSDAPVRAVIMTDAFQAGQHALTTAMFATRAWRTTTMINHNGRDPHLNITTLP